MVRGAAEDGDGQVRAAAGEGDSVALHVLGGGLVINRVTFGSDVRIGRRDSDGQQA